MTLEWCMTCVTFYESLKNEKNLLSKIRYILVLISLHVAIIILLNLTDPKSQHDGTACYV